MKIRHNHKNAIKAAKYNDKDYTIMYEVYVNDKATDKEFDTEDEAYDYAEKLVSKGKSNVKIYKNFYNYNAKSHELSFVDAELCDTVSDKEVKASRIPTRRRAIKASTGPILIRNRKAIEDELTDLLIQFDKDLNDEYATDVYLVYNESNATASLTTVEQGSSKPSGDSYLIYTDEIHDPDDIWDIFVYEEADWLSAFDIDEDTFEDLIRQYFDMKPNDRITVADEINYVKSNPEFMNILKEDYGIALDEMREEYEIKAEEILNQFDAEMDRTYIGSSILNKGVNSMKIRHNHKNAIKSACGKKSVKSSSKRRAVKAAYGGWGKFYGLNDVEFTVPNDTDDPTIFYNGKYYNYYAIEDTLWDYYKEECAENGVKPNENEFENWVAENSYLVYDLLDEISPKSEPGRGVYREEANTLRGPVKSSRMSARRRAIKSARTLEIYTYDELTPEQQQYVLSNWSDMRKLADVIYDWFDEDEMFVYNDEKQFIADKYANMYGLGINPDKAYWQSNSQGPYPEWSLDQVFDTYCGETTTGIPYCIEFYGRGLDVQCSLDVDGYYDEGEPTESDIDAKLGMPIGEIMQGAQQYIDELWQLINNVCQAYPDDEWVSQTIESNPDSFEFTVSDDGTVKYF